MTLSEEENLLITQGTGRKTTISRDGQSGMSRMNPFTNYERSINQAMEYICKKQGHRQTVHCPQAGQREQREL